MRDRFLPFGEPLLPTQHDLGAAVDGGFRGWFGSSRVVDSHGRPRVVFHGTGASFQSFRVPAAGEGLFFAEDPAWAGVHAPGVGGYLVPVYLRVANPVCLRSSSGIDRRALQALGFDGARVESAAVGVVWVAFNTEQIRSAIDGQAFEPGRSDSLERAVRADSAGLALPAQVAAVLTDEELTDPDVREFAWRVRQVQAEEKESDPDDWTVQERAAYEAGDWRRFSRLRGYTEQQIGNYGRFMDLARRLDARYGDGYAQELGYGLQCCSEDPDPVRVRQSAP